MTVAPDGPRPLPAERAGLEGVEIDFRVACGDRPFVEAGVALGARGLDLEGTRTAIGWAPAQPVFGHARTAPSFWLTPLLSKLPSSVQ